MYTADLANAAKDGFGQLFADRNSQSTAAAIDQIQRGLQCCGTTGPASWGVGSIPQSCCAEASCNLLNSHPTGCSTMLADFINRSGLLIAWFAIIFAGIELVGVIFACCRKYCILFVIDLKVNGCSWLRLVLESIVLYFENSTQIHR